jgi:molybdate transport system ATP-binding protein
VFQEARLFPHMTVRRNLLYAQWFGGRRGSAGASFEAVVDMLGVGRLLPRYPSHLSGGEKQRVAIGRALLSHPRLLLMDEPLASLDEARKQEILPYIERLRDEAHAPIVYVSHSLAEVRRLADHVVVMGHGAVVAAGPPRLVLGPGADPESLEGLNILDVQTLETRADGTLAAITPAGVLSAPAGSRPSRIGIRPDRVVIAMQDPGRTSAAGVLVGVVGSIGPAGEGGRKVRVLAGGAEINANVTAAFMHDSGLREGAKVYLVMTDVLAL